MSCNFCNNNNYANGLPINICTSVASFRLLREVQKNQLQPLVVDHHRLHLQRQCRLFPAHLIEYKKLFKSTLYCDYD